ncbi:MAG: hypothetical protein AAGJ31_15720, partial [Verrucomicrobiota bacterium]
MRGMRRSIKGGILTAMLLLSAGATAQTPGIAQARIPRLEFEEMPLRETIEYLRAYSREADARGVGWNFVLDPKVSGDAPVSLLLRDVPLSVAMAYTLELGGARFEADAHAIRVVPMDPQYSKQDSTPNASLIKRAKALRMERVGFEEMPLGEVLDYLSERSDQLDPRGAGISLLLHPQVSRDIPVTLDLKNVPLGTVVYYVAERCQLRLRIDPWAIVLLPPAVQAPESRSSSSSSSSARGSDSSRSQPAPFENKV